MSNVWKMTIGDRIASLRSRRGLTQAELGELCGWSDSRIGAYERNEVKKPKPASLMKLAEAFHMTYEEFMKGVNIE